VGWYRVKFRPDRLRALAAAQQAYDLQARGHAADVAFYEQQLRRTRVVGVWAIAAGTLVGLAAVFLSGL